MKKYNKPALNIEKIELNDWDKSWREGYILIYCDKCSNQIEVRRK